MQMAYWMPKAYPWRVAILAILAKMANRSQRAGDSIWAQLFEDRLALNPGLNLTLVSFSCVQKHFLG